jgi:hypothetical protein
MDDRLAARLRGFGPLGILAVVLILAGNALFTPLSAILVLIWTWISRTPWREIGYVRPKSWLRTLALSIVFGAALKLVMKALVMPLLGAPAINQAFHYLVGNRAALPGILFLVMVGAGFGEETVFRGYLFERFGKLLENDLGQDINGRAYLRVVRGDPLPFPGPGRRAASHPGRVALRHVLRAQTPDLSVDHCPHRLRPDGSRHHLLGPRNRGRSFHLQIGIKLNRGLRGFHGCFESRHGIVLPPRPIRVIRDIRG